jgi:hypothetical protein
MEQTAFLKTKQLVAQVQALTVIRKGKLFKLDVTVEPKGYGYSLWQRQMVHSAYWFLVSIMERR